MRLRLWLASRHDTCSVVGRERAVVNPVGCARGKLGGAVRRVCSLRGGARRRGRRRRGCREAAGYVYDDTCWVDERVFVVVEPGREGES